MQPLIYPQLYLVIRQRLCPFQNGPKDLDSFYKTDYIFRAVLEEKNLKAKLYITDIISVVRLFKTNNVVS